MRGIVRVVDRAGRLVVRREIALRVGGAPPEDVAGPPRATRDQVPVGILGAGHLERQLVGRRRPLALDVPAVGVARATEERAEPPALRRQDPFAALWARVALAL